jgi:hypothetical protein
MTGEPPDGIAPGTDTGAPDRSPEGVPRWVKVFALIAGALVLLFLVVHLAGGGMGNHGLGR